MSRSDRRGRVIWSWVGAVGQLRDRVGYDRLTGGGLKQSSEVGLVTSGDGHIMGHRGLMLEIGDVLPVVRSEANIAVGRGLDQKLTMILITLGLGR